MLQRRLHPEEPQHLLLLPFLSLLLNAERGRHPPDRLSSRSLRYFGAEVDHKDLEGFWDIWQLPDRH